MSCTIREGSSFTAGLTPEPDSCTVVLGPTARSGILRSVAWSVKTQQLSASKIPAGTYRSNTTDL